MPMRGNRRAVALLAILLGVGAFQAWFLDIHRSNLTHRAATADLSDQYARGLAGGHAYFSVSSTPLAPDAPFHIVDASYFKGRYYIYFGIGPFVLLLLPWYLLTGTYLSMAVCILGALLFGYAAYGTALWLLFREDRRAAVDWLLPAGFLAVVIGSGTWALLDNPAIHEMESAWGFAALAGALACLAAARAGAGRPRLALCGASLFAGLTVACRPNCLPAALLVGGVAAALAGSREERPFPRIRAALVCLAPMAVIGVMLAVWNYVRFDSIFEFGVRYNTSALLHPVYSTFSARNVAYNLHRYLFGGIRWGSYFPFIDGVREGPSPLPTETHEPVDQIYGCFLLFPVLAYGALALRKRRRLGAFLFAAGAGNLCILAGLGIGTYRYAPDFLGPVALAAGLGICGLADRGGGLTRRLALLLLAPLLVWSGAAGLCEAVSISRVRRNFDLTRPADFARLARPFNQLAYRLERVGKAGPRALEFTVSLPIDKYGLDEPLLVSGDVGLEDFIYFRYPGPGWIQLGFESIGYGGLVSAPVQIDYARKHVVGVWLGNLLPPDDHPLLQSMAPGDRALARQFLHLTIDGRVILEGGVNLHPTRSRFLYGESPDDGAFGRKFTGTIWRIDRPLLSRVGLYPRWDRSQFGPILMTFRLRSAGAAGGQPLVSLGYPPRGGLLVLDRLPSGAVQLQWRLLGAPPLTGDLPGWSDAAVHTLELRAGVLLPPVESSLWDPGISGKARTAAKRVLSCSVDGRVILRREEDTPDAPPASVRCGENTLFLPGVAGSLDGEVLSSRREGW
jgi:hypothetical protein